MRWAQSRSLPAGDVFRARLILALADGMTYEAIKGSLHTTAPTISRWKQRFEQMGLDGLEPQHKGSKPRTATPAVQAKICRKVQLKPGDGSTHWSVRKLAAETGVSKSTYINPIPSATAAASTAALHDEQRSRLRGQGCGHNRTLFWYRRSMQPCFAWMRRPRFRRSIAWTRSCRCRLDERSDTGSNITDMEPYRCTRHWM